MNLFKFAKISVVLVTAVAIYQPAVTQDFNTKYDDALACVWLPVCGDPDIYSPVLQPKESKTETQDAKDEKVA